MPSSVTVAVPATSANLGPGFDCLGVALSLHNQFTFSLLSTGAQEVVAIEVTGEEAARVKTDSSNLAYQSFVKLYTHLGKNPPPVKIEIRLSVPLARGLGSSATAIVGGLVAANVLAGSPLTQTDVMNLAIAIEGHPDNVVPALLGGCRLTTAREDQNWDVCLIPWHGDVIPVLAIPNFELSTHQARSILPDSISRADAIFNIAHVGLLLRALQEGRTDWLQTALADRLHQPYRQSLIPGYEAVRMAAIEAGAYGLVISGAGPTLLALTNGNYAEAVGAAMSHAWTAQQMSSSIKILQIDTQGVVTS